MLLDAASLAMPKRKTSVGLHFETRLGCCPRRIFAKMGRFVQMRTGQSSTGLCGSPEASIFSVIVPVWFSDICDARAQNPSFVAS